MVRVLRSGYTLGTLPQLIPQRYMKGHTIQINIYELLLQEFNFAPHGKVVWQSKAKEVRQRTYEPSKQSTPNKYQLTYQITILQRNTMTNYQSGYPGPTTTHDHKKIFCAYHRTQFLTNFCIEKDCLMPLCPSCVAQHTEYHNKTQNRATYINLQQAIQQTRQKCYSYIVTMEENQRRNEQIMQHMRDIEDYIHQQLAHAKQQIYSYIEKMFRDYENQVYETITKKYQQNKIYNMAEGQDIQNSIALVIDSLYDRIGTLKSQQCLAALITYYAEDQETDTQLFLQFDQYFNRHKQGKFNVILNQKELSTILTDLCARVLVTAITNQNTLNTYPIQVNDVPMRRNYSNYIKPKFPKHIQSQANIKAHQKVNKRDSRVRQQSYNDF